MDSDAAPGGRRGTRAWRSPVAWITLLGALLLGLALDLGSKAWAFNTSTIAGEAIALDREALLADPYANPIPRHDGVRALPLDLLDFRALME